MKRIMIVEDDLTALKAFALLFQNDYEVEKYSDANEALKRIKQNFYDLIIADLFLNGVNGLDLYNATPHKSSFIIITGYPDTELALKAKSLLGDRFILKSSPPEVLKSKIASILNPSPLKGEGKSEGKQVKKDG